jgi:hypothetical protein
VQRTTLTLDDDVAVRLKSEVRRTGRPFKELVNEHLRRSLNTSAKPVSEEPFRIKARNLGLRPGLSYDNIGELLEQVEGPLYK